MSCKYCTPLPSTGETEPLVDESYKVDWSRDPVRAMAWIEGNKLIVEGLCAHLESSHGERTIDYCPVCGDSLRPFGPSWTINT